jgi:hypothetical protein
LKKISKLPIFVQKYLINILAMLYVLPLYLCKDPPPVFFYFLEIPEIFPYKTPDLEYVNFATPCITSGLVIIGE